MCVIYTKNRPSSGTVSLEAYCAHINERLRCMFEVVIAVDGLRVTGRHAGRNYRCKGQQSHRESPVLASETVLHNTLFSIYKQVPEIVRPYRPNVVSQLPVAKHLAMMKHQSMAQPTRKIAIVAELVSWVERTSEEIASGTEQRKVSSRTTWPLSRLPLES